MNLLKKRKEKRNKKNLENNNSRFIESYPYRFSDLYTYHGGKLATVVRLFVRPGSNRNLTFLDVLRLVPSSIESDIEVVFAISDKIVVEEEKKKLIRENAKKNKNTITSSTGDAKSNKDVKEEDNTTDKIIVKRLEMSDYETYESIIQSNEPIVSYEIKMMIIGKEVGVIENFISDLNTSLNKKYDGLSWDALTGDSKRDFENFLIQHRERKKMHSSIGSNYAILNFTMSAGLNDLKGVPIGKDSLSFFNSTSFFDFNGSTKRKAIISMPKNSRMLSYKREDETFPKTSSLIAQAAANHVAMNGHRVFHLVLNDFDYSESKLYYRPRDTFEKNIFEKNDVSKITINPLQGYGEVEEVVNIFSRLKSKIANMFNILMDFKLSVNDTAIILEALNGFYISNKLWNYDAARNPARTHIVNISKPETYPTLGRFISSLTSSLSEAKNEGREAKIDRVEALKTLLDDALTSYENVLGKTSTITKSESLQTYYDFNKISDRKVKQVQLLSLIDYVIWQAKPNDLIVIHGFDTVDRRVLYMIEETINSAMDLQGIRFLFAFDTISNAMYDGSKNTDMFDLKGPIYKNLDSDIDWTMVGDCLPEEVEMYERALNLQLSETIRGNMRVSTNAMALIHRRAGSINNFAYMNVII